MPRIVIRRVFVLIALILLRALVSALPPMWTVFSVPGEGYDFMGYYIASCLVAEGDNASVYDEAEKDVDPVEAYADPNSVFGRTARAKGITEISLYDYPPTLADLLLPLAFLSSLHAFVVWFFFNIAAVAAIGLIFSRTLGFHAFGKGALVSLFLFCFRPTLSCLYLGQAEILLLMLMIAGVGLYIQRRHDSAAFLFALAAAIKLAPLILLVPLIAWQDWKAVRAFVGWLVVILVGLFAINGWHAMNLYFLHELPKMSGAGIDLDNRSLGVAAEAIFHVIRKDIPFLVLSWLGKLISLSVVLVAAMLSRTKRESPPEVDRKMEVLVVFMLLASCLSPVAGLHMYVLAAPALIVFGKRLWENRLGVLEAALFVTFLLTLSAEKYVFLKVVSPIAAATLALLVLYRIRKERIAETSHRDLIPSPAMN